MDGCEDARAPAPPPQACGLQIISQSGQAGEQPRQGLFPRAPPRPTPPFLTAPPRRPLPGGPSPRRSRLQPHLLRLCSGGGEASRSACGAGPEPSRGRGSGEDPRRRGLWDRDGRGDRDHIPRRRYRAAEPGEEEGSRGGARGQRSDSELAGGKGRGRREGPGPGCGRLRETPDELPGGPAYNPPPSPSAPAHLGNEGGGPKAGVCGPPPPRAATAAVSPATARLSANADFPGSGFGSALLALLSELWKPKEGLGLGSLLLREPPSNAPHPVWPPRRAVPAGGTVASCGDRASLGSG
jgi:hypothetical protein